MHIDASCELDTLAGYFLGKLYYETRVFDLLSRDEFYGCPNDGMQHTLRFRASRETINTFLSIVQEKYSKVRGCKEFIAHVQGKL